MTEADGMVYKLSGIEIVRPPPTSNNKRKSCDDEVQMKKRKKKEREREIEEREIEEREIEEREREIEMVPEEQVPEEQLFSIELPTTNGPNYPFNVCVEMAGVKKFINESQVLHQAPTAFISKVIHPSAAKYFVVCTDPLLSVLIFEKGYCTLMVIHGEDIVEYNGVNHNQVHKIGDEELKVLFFSN